MIGIYKITNTINSHAYIGQSIDIARRWRDEKTRAIQVNSESHDLPLSRAFRKYGIENFVFEVLEETEITQLNEREKYWAKYYNTYLPNGYNVVECGGGNRLHAKPYWVPLVINLLLEGKNNREIADAFNNKPSWRTISDFNCGKCWYDENIDYPIRRDIHGIKCRYTNNKEEKLDKLARQQIKATMAANKKVSDITKTKQFSIEEKYDRQTFIAELQAHYQDWSMTDWSEYHNISDMQLRRILKRLNVLTIPAYRKQIKEQQLEENVVQKLDTCVIRDDGKEYPNGSQAAKDNGGEDKDATHIYDCCKGKRQTAYGHKWQFKVPRN